MFISSFERLFLPKSFKDFVTVFPRILTYNEGLGDLHSGENGAPVIYDFILVIRDITVEDGNGVLGWGRRDVEITGAYEELLAEAVKKGLIELPQ